MKNKTKVQHAIDESQRYTKIVHIDDDVGVLAELRRRVRGTANGGDVVSGDVHEFWGGTGRGEWRVHVNIHRHKQPPSGIALCHGRLVRATKGPNR
jgi:hypothetical protein